MIDKHGEVEARSDWMEFSLLKAFWRGLASLSLKKNLLRLSASRVRRNGQVDQLAGKFSGDSN
ncbi:hypothetical protein Bca4012_099287 [Brassica carinata]